MECSTSQGTSPSAKPIFRYFNDGVNRPTEEPNLNCAAHYGTFFPLQTEMKDPGFVTLSILSTAPGLQLKDLQTDKWIDGPYNPMSGNDFPCSQNNEKEPTMILESFGSVMQQRK